MREWCEGVEGEVKKVNAMNSTSNTIAAVIASQDTHMIH